MQYFVSLILEKARQNYTKHKNIILKVSLPLSECLSINHFSNSDLLTDAKCSTKTTLQKSLRHLVTLPKCHYLFTEMVVLFTPIHPLDDILFVSQHFFGMLCWSLFGWQKNILSHDTLLGNSSHSR